VNVGVLWPGRRCDLCGALIVTTAVVTPHGGAFCTSHTDLPHCYHCGAPHRRPGRFCHECSKTAINTQDQLRVALPPIRAQLIQMGIWLNPPVHVQLVDEAWMKAMNPHESGMVGGLTQFHGQQVREVYIVAGMPALEFGSTVVHEVMHAWLAQNGVPQDDARIAEGLCQVVSYRWLRDQPGPLAAFVREKIERDPDPIYGDGFRMVRESVRRHGMNQVIAAIKSTGRLP
jgi:hypothetical protein